MLPDSLPWADRAEEAEKESEESKRSLIYGIPPI